MGFFKKMMAAAGVGAARVETQLETPMVRIGEQLRGVIGVTGGNVPQRIERLNVGLITQYKADDQTRQHRLSEGPVSGAFDLQPGERRELPFSLLIPPQTPLSLPGTQVWLNTDADIAGAMDPGDNDPLQILPNAEMACVIGAAQRLGFSLTGSEVEFHRGQLVQELSFRPSQGAYPIAELELVFQPAPGGLGLVLEVDRRSGGLSGLLLGETEGRGRCFIPQAELDRGTQGVAAMLEAQIRRLL